MKKNVRYFFFFLSKRIYLSWIQNIHISARTSKKRRSTLNNFFADQLKLFLQLPKINLQHPFLLEHYIPCIWPLRLCSPLINPAHNLIHITDFKYTYDVNVLKIKKTSSYETAKSLSSRKSSCVPTKIFGVSGQKCRTSRFHWNNVFVDNQTYMLWYCGLDIFLLFVYYLTWFLTFWSDERSTNEKHTRKTSCTTEKVKVKVKKKN